MLRGFSLLILVLCCIVPVYAQDISIIEGFSVPSSPLGSVPDTLNGTEIPTETGTQLFSYAKWLFSETGARELLGATLAPIAINLYALLTLTIAMTIIWFAIRLFVLTLRFFLFGLREFARAVELIPFVE